MLLAPHNYCEVACGKTRTGFATSQVSYYTVHGCGMVLDARGQRMAELKQPLTNKEKIRFGCNV